MQLEAKEREIESLGRRLRDIMELQDQTSVKHEESVLAVGPVIEKGEMKRFGSAPRSPKKPKSAPLVSVDHIKLVSVLPDTPKPQVSSIYSSTPQVTAPIKERKEVDVVPRQTSIPLALSFFERLDWFAKTSVQNLQGQRDIIQSQERLENERRLRYLKLLEEEPNNRLDGPMTAEFMPVPGIVPIPKSRTSFLYSAHALNGPWGGRFKMQENTSSSKVLNLFGEVMNLGDERETEVLEDEEEW